MKVLVTGASGSIGAALIPRLAREGYELRAFALTPSGVAAPVPVVRGDVLTGVGLDEAMDGVEVAYYLIHSMEASTDGAFSDRERRGAENFVAAAERAGTRRIVYLGGLVPDRERLSPHLGSRLAVERILLAHGDSTALRASIVIGATSRSFRFLVRLVERLPVLALPAWRDNRTQPIDVRDILDMLVHAATIPAAGGRSLDVGGPDVLTYGEMIRRIAHLMLVGRPAVGLPLTATPLASRVAAVIAEEAHDLIGPLMESLESDLLPRGDDAAALLGVRLHTFDAAVERALREWEDVEPLAAR
jgi:uncharacterized protein YbjT (DUF2867 family)